MTLTTYLLYLAAVALLVLSPGPTMLMCITTALNHGSSKALTSVVGSVSAVLCVMLLSAMGLGALLATSEAAFTVAKVVGAAYLIYLGIKTFAVKPPFSMYRQRQRRPRGNARSFCVAFWSAPAIRKRCFSSPLSFRNSSTRPRLSHRSLPSWH